MKKPKPHLSPRRLELRRLVEEIHELTEVFLVRRLMVRGSVYQLRRKCGKPTCACASGELHASWVLSSSEDGRTRLRTIPEKERGRWEVRTGHYRGFRQARARLIVLHRKMLEIIDEIERALLREP